MKQSKTEGRNSLFSLMGQSSNGDIVYKKTQTVPFYLRADKPVCCENRVKISGCKFISLVYGKELALICFFKEGRQFLINGLPSIKR